MKMISKLILTVAMLALAISASAQGYPSKPLRLVVPFGPGGPSDTLARAIGERLTASMGQPVIIENKPGANTIIGADYVSKAPADGYTLLLGTDATYSINPLLYSKLPYSQTDLVPIVAVAHLPEYLMISSNVPATNLAEFISYAKKNPGKLSYGSFGNGSNAHLAGEAFKLAIRCSHRHASSHGHSGFAIAARTNRQGRKSRS